MLTRDCDTAGDTAIELDSTSKLKDGCGVEAVGSTVKDVASELKVSSIDDVNSELKARSDVEGDASSAEDNANVGSSSEDRAEEATSSLVTTNSDTEVSTSVVKVGDSSTKVVDNTSVGCNAVSDA